MTLVELLIVIVIMLLITGVAVRVTAPALAGRRVREAARMVDVYINGARTRAMQTGRPYGVMIHRTPVPPNGQATIGSSMGISLAYAEVPPPYTGDFSPTPGSPGSTIRLLGNGAFGAIDPLTGSYDPSASIFALGDVGWVNNVSPGDLLVVRGTVLRLWAGEPFVDTALPGVSGVPFNGVYDLGEPFADCDYSGGYTPPNLAYIDPVTGFFWLGPTASLPYPPPGSAIITYMYYDLSLAAATMNPTGRDLGNPLNQITFSPPAASQDSIQFVANPSPPPPLKPVAVPAPGYTFSIIRRPIMAAGTDQQLPDGAAIDLGGFDFSGNTTQLNVVPGSGMDIFSTVPGVPAYFATFRANPNFGGNDNSPVVITFAPNGAVDRVFSWDERNYAVYPPGATGVTVYGPGWQGRQPTSQIFLLVTRRELIGGDSSALAAAPPDPLTATSAPPQFGIQDLNSLWVTINPMTGMVNTAANGAIDPKLLNPGGGLPPPYAIQCYEARQPARKSQNAGGR